MKKQTNPTIKAHLLPATMQKFCIPAAVTAIGLAATLLSPSLLWAEAKLTPEQKKAINTCVNKYKGAEHPTGTSEKGRRGKPKLDSIKYAPPVQREVVAEDFITGIKKNIAAETKKSSDGKFHAKESPSPATILRKKPRLNGSGLSRARPQSISGRPQSIAFKPGRFSIRRPVEKSARSSDLRNSSQLELQTKNDIFGR